MVIGSRPAAARSRGPDRRKVRSRHGPDAVANPVVVGHIDVRGVAAIALIALTDAPRRSALQPTTGLVFTLVAFISL